MASAQELCVYLLLNPFGILLIPIKEKRVLILRIKKKMETNINKFLLTVSIWASSPEKYL